MTDGPTWVSMCNWHGFVAESTDPRVSKTLFYKHVEDMWKMHEYCDSECVEVRYPE
jgi:hypothetical protein